MRSYKYTVLTKNQKKISGIFRAHNEQDLDQKMSKFGLTLISCRIYKKRFKKTRCSKIDIVNLCVQISEMTKVSMPIIEIFETILVTVDSLNLYKILEVIIQDIKNGKLISESFAEHPKIFDNVFVGMVKMGEETGDLSFVFDEIASHLKWSLNIRGKIRSAMIYPFVLLCMIAVMLFVMMNYVVPNITKMLVSQGVELPFYTVWLINTSRFFQYHSHHLILGVLSFWLFCTFFIYISENIAYRYHAFKLKIPIIGDLVLKIELSRFCHFFSMTYRSGIKILDCFDVGHDIIKNRVLQESIEVAKDAIESGSTITDALTVTGRFPNMVIKMFHIGENTGKMEEALKNITYFYDKEVNSKVQKLIASIQPILICIVGAIIIWVIIAVFGPLYNNLQTLF